MHARWPHCSIHIFEGSNGRSAWKSIPRGAVPDFVQVHAVDLTQRAGDAFESALADIGRLAVLRINCHGCEYATVLPHLVRQCPTQILMDVCLGDQRTTSSNARLLHSLARAYGVFHAAQEVDPSLGGCVDFGLLRRVHPTVGRNATASRGAVVNCV